jgi:thiol-disulfide isomerase/thioredoxin
MIPIFGLKDKDTQMAPLIRYGIIAMLLFALGSVVYVWTQASSTKIVTGDIKSYATGKLSRLVFDDAIRPPMPTSPILDATGAERSLYEMDTQIIVLNLWHIYCPPCVYEMPTLADLQDRFPETDLKVVVVSFDKPSEYDKAKRKLDDLSKGRLEFYGAPNGRLLQETRMYGFPTTIIYRSNGCEVARYSGDTEWDSPEAIRLFNALLEQPDLRNDCT